MHQPVARILFGFLHHGEIKGNPHIFGWLDVPSTLGLRLIWYVLSFLKNKYGTDFTLSKDNKKYIKITDGVSRQIINVLQPWTGQGPGVTRDAQPFWGPLFRSDRSHWLNLLDLTDHFDLTFQTHLITLTHFFSILDQNGWNIDFMTLLLTLYWNLARRGIFLIN